VRAELEKGGWVAFADVEPWIDERFGRWARLGAGWQDMDHVLAEALSGGLVSARGHSDRLALLLVRIEPGATVDVDSLLRCVTVTLTSPGRGPGLPMSRVEKRVYQDVEFSAETLRSWCALVLGLPLAGAPERTEVERPTVGPQVKRNRAKRVADVLFPDGFPDGMTKAAIVDDIGARLRAEETEDSRLVPMSADTIRRALGFKV